MPTMLQITSHLSVTPLVAIRHPLFEKLYRDGIYRSLLKERCASPLTDRYMLENVRAALAGVAVDGQHMIGFHFGRLHGAILSPETGELRPNVTALARFQNENAARGYTVGREYYFMDAQPDERITMDSSLLERLQELEREALYFHEEEDTWYYALGCILGELSGPLFPITSQESAQWEAERQDWRAAYKRSRCQESHTEPLAREALQEA